MTMDSRIASSLLCCACAATSTALAQVTDGKAYPPSGYEDAILEFERQDRRQFPPLGAVVLTGSSQIRKWNTIEADLAPLTVIHRGYGGSTFHDALHYAERIVIPYKPRAIVLYAGGNDLAQGVGPETIRDTFRAFVEKVRGQLPEVRIYVLSILPSILRWNDWPVQQETSRLIKAYCAGKEYLTCIDVPKAMFGADGMPRRDVFEDDILHINAEGYRLWRDTILPVLVKRELPLGPDNR